MKATTNKKTLNAMLKEKNAALEVIAAYSEYRKKYNTEHPDNKVVESKCIIKEIIALHKKGKSKQQIIELGYNKNTVRRNVALFEKGLKKETTIIKQYLVEEEEESEDDE